MYGIINSNVSYVYLHNNIVSGSVMLS